MGKTGIIGLTESKNCEVGNDNFPVCPWHCPQGGGQEGNVN